MSNRLVARRSFLVVFGIVLAIAFALAFALPQSLSSAAAEENPAASAPASSSATPASDSAASSSSALAVEPTEPTEPTGSDAGATSPAAALFSPEVATAQLAANDATAPTAGAADSSVVSTMSVTTTDTAGGSPSGTSDGETHETIHWDTNAGGTNGMHYVYSVPGDSNSTPIYLYCMNNKLHWPHTSDTISSIPDYVQGYLTPDMFSSQEQYRECMDKLLAILYAGYPYNGMNYYTLVDASTISADDFDALLVVPEYLRADFSDSLGDTTFTWSDYTDAAKMAKIDAFMKEVGQYFPTSSNPNPVTSSGMTYGQITQLPFYKAALAMQYAAWNPGATPMDEYSQMDKGETSLTEQQAYDQTQDAVWVLLTEYGVPNNQFTREDISSETFALKLLSDADASNVLDSKPSSDAVSITGDAGFSYDATTKTWRTGTLKISEGEDYHGMYTLALPDGFYANTVGTADAASQADVKTIAGGQEFYLVTATQPTQSITLKADATVPWLQEVRQYSPTPDSFTAFDGKSFQHMIGALIYRESLSTSTSVAPTNEGDLTVSKAVVGSQDASATFSFTVTLSGDNAALTGEYGDMTLDGGVAKFSLAAGESKTAANLPAGLHYTVTEDAADGYTTTSKNAEGVITSGLTAEGDITPAGKAQAAFTNTRTFALAIGKQVAGKAADTAKAFPITVTLADADGNAVNGDFAYTGGAAGGSNAPAPADGTLTFVDGTATIDLASGQTIAIAGVPAGTTYAVSEAANGHAGYDASYSPNATGTIAADAAVTVTNTLRTGTLSVTKHVEGEQGSTATFDFTVTLTGAGAHLTGDFGDMTFDEGVAHFKLGDGQSCEATDLPEGTGYTATETDAKGYTTASQNAEGVIVAAQKAEATFTNTLKPTTPVTPDEPDNPDNPKNPDNPDNPDNPTNPDKPSNPGNPDKPDNPDTPGNPDNPDNPDEPSNPDNPSNPDKPANPGNPDNPGGSTDMPSGSVTDNAQDATDGATASPSSAGDGAASTPSTGDAATLVPLVACAAAAASVAALALARRRRKDGLR